MNKKLTKDEKLTRLKDMYDGLTSEQIENLENIANVDLRYKRAQSYKRAISQGKYGERKKAMEYYRRYHHILEGLDCIEKKLWTNRSTIEAFGRELDAWGEKCVQLIDEVNRRHMQSLLAQRNKLDADYESERNKLSKKIEEFVKEVGGDALCLSKG